MANTKPAVNANDHSLHLDQWSQVAGWISYSDADGNAATQYQFWDSGTGATSGYFWTPDQSPRMRRTRPSPSRPPISPTSGCAAASGRRTRPCGCAPSTAPTGATGTRSPSRRWRTRRRWRPSTTTACTSTSGRRSRAGSPTRTPTAMRRPSISSGTAAPAPTAAISGRRSNAHHAADTVITVALPISPMSGCAAAQARRRGDDVGARLRRHRLGRLGLVHLHHDFRTRRPSRPSTTTACRSTSGRR